MQFFFCGENKGRDRRMGLTHDDSESADVLLDVGEEGVAAPDIFVFAGVECLGGYCLIISTNKEC